MGPDAPHKGTPRNASFVARPPFIPRQGPLVLPAAPRSPISAFFPIRKSRLNAAPPFAPCSLSCAAPPAVAQRKYKARPPAMRCSFLCAFAVAVLTLASSAAPVPAPASISSGAMDVRETEPVPAPFVALEDAARAAEPHQTPNPLRRAAAGCGDAYDPARSTSVPLPPPLHHAHLHHFAVVAHPTLLPFTPAALEPARACVQACGLYLYRHTAMARRSVSVFVSPYPPSGSDSPSAHILHTQVEYFVLN
ncbi:hypothetical protein B0H15DRAFT_1020701 [Mycena belliarum]|uniref:Uncharacterized protein n=1 Tax=Mycena belliarum TaxID=1033014 RepID=A0AAD6UBY3_9AGAR|nr:hypothetical protein B0H15DRAFT_1020701 [Mycena belliae]